MIFFSAREGKIGVSKAIGPLDPVLPFFYARIPSGPIAFLLFLNFLFLAMAAPLSARDNTTSFLPEIHRLDPTDVSFKQFLADMEASRRLLFSSRAGPGTGETDRIGEIASFLTVYAYVPREDEELMGIAARCNIPYSTIASINRFSHSEDMPRGKTLLLPSIPGVFIPESPTSDLERLIFSSRAAEDYGGSRYEGINLSVPREGKTEKFRFIPGDDFTPIERIYFLNRGFRYPLQSFQVSSTYGPRVNPVTGVFSIHRGVDLSASEKSEVYTVRDGTVAEIGEDPVLGKYVIVRHDNNWVSFYGHLYSIDTSLHAELRSGNLIGRVGSTGQSTGPHLHFELRQNGQSIDPARLLGIFKDNTR